jgi:uncharacterized DUF497 family protein
MFEWDEDKRLWTLKERGLDFFEAVSMFDGRTVFHMPVFKKGEERTVTIGLMHKKFYAVVWTWRGETRRIISFRRARYEEEKAYQTLFN